MRIVIVLALALCLEFAYGADNNSNATRRMAEIMSDIIRLYRDQRGGTFDKVSELQKYFPDQIRKWNCPVVERLPSLTCRAAVLSCAYVGSLTYLWNCVCCFAK